MAWVQGREELFGVAHERCHVVLAGPGGVDFVQEYVHALCSRKMRMVNCCDVHEVNVQLRL